MKEFGLRGGARPWRPSDPPMYIFSQPRLKFLILAILLKKIGENINFQTTLLVDTMNIGKTGADPGFPVGRGADPPRDANVRFCHKNTAWN